MYHATRWFQALEMAGSLASFLSQELGKELVISCYVLCGHHWDISPFSFPSHPVHLKKNMGQSDKVTIETQSISYFSWGKSICDHSSKWETNGQSCPCRHGILIISSPRFELCTGALPFMATTVQPSAWTRLHKRGPKWEEMKTCAESKTLCHLENLIWLDQKNVKKHVGNTSDKKEH